MQRAYSLLTVKSVDHEQRIVIGIATTPAPDTVDDIIEPLGVAFTNPLPLLLHHDAKSPVGRVWFDEPTPAGITFRAHLPEIAETGSLKERVDMAWQSVKHGLIPGVSIGFSADHAHVERRKTGGLHIKKSRVHELSLVTVPAHQDARITGIRELKALDDAATGETIDSPTHATPSGATDIPRVVKTTLATKGARPMTIQEQITSFEATRQAKNARMVELMTAAGTKGETLGETESQEYDGLQSDVKSLDAHLTRLAALEKANIAAAVPVKGTTPETASASRGASVIAIKKELPKGTGFVRYAMALAATRGARFEAAEYAKRWEGSTPEVAMVLKQVDIGTMQKAAMTAGTTTDSDWAAPLVVYQNMASEFVELLRPATIIGRLSLRRVPFNVTMPTQTQGSTVGWVGQGKPKPVGELKFGQLSLGMAKAAGIIVISEELARSSDPAAEGLIRGDMIAAMAEFLDEQFIDPSVAEVSNVSPAAITNGVTPVEATGTNAAALRTDFKTLVATFLAANQSLSGAAWIMTETQALALSLMQNALGQPEFPAMSITGGTLFGLPVVASENVPAEGGSPSGNRIILVKQSDILLADDGQTIVDVSREASLQMNSTPDDPATASTVYVSLWQNNLVGLRAERFINWKRRRTESVGMIEGAVYTG